MEMKKAMRYICNLSDGSKVDMAERDRALATGLVMRFAVNHLSNRGPALGGLAVLIQRAIEVGQIVVFVNSAHECVGFAIWATLTPEVERRFIGGKPRQLAPWEFNDGASTWVLDFAAAPGQLRPILENLRDVVFKDREYVTYHRVKAQGRLCKRLSRADRTSFMAAGRSVQRGAE